MSSVLVTGFGPFQGFTANPSETLAKAAGHHHAVLEVSYDAVDDFFNRLDPDSFDVLLMLGLHGSTTVMRLEVLAHNWIGSTRDVRGEAPTGFVQDGPPILAGTLWRSLPLDHLLEKEPLCLSYHPGSYLCNYIYYRALCLFPEKRVGFLHVPEEKALPLRRQTRALSALLDLVNQPVPAR
jgi:Pyrrolidone-carboxylate peptidase (N-terminal pyroglutamyl peptidase)